MAMRSIVLVAGLAFTLAQDCTSSDETCRTGSDIDEVPSSAMIQSRVRQTGEKAVATSDGEGIAGETVHVECDPQCHDVEKFSLTVASPRHGTATYELVRNRNLVAEDHHILFIQEDGSEVKKKMPEHLLSCHYYGDGIVLSTCHGWRATIMRKFDDLYLSQKLDGTFVLGETKPPEKNPGLSMLELEDYVPLAGVCGDGAINEGEECDGGACCDDDCTFKKKGASCDGGVIDYCTNGEEGQCSGADAMCYIPMLPNGTPCPDGGFCHDGECASRDRECEDAGWTFGACGESECGALKCVSVNQTCEVAGDDYLVRNGVPCGDSKMCEDSKCIDVDVPPATEVRRPAQKTEAKAQNMQAPTANLIMVFTGAAVKAGYTAAKMPAWVNYANSHYSRMGLTIRAGRTIETGTPFMLTPTQDLNKCQSWLKSARSKNQVPATMGPAAFFGGVPGPCRAPGAGGVAGVGDACKNYGSGLTKVVGGGGTEICQLTDRIVTHELGHNVGMKHIIDVLGGPTGGDYQMEIGFGKDGFHPRSIAAYRSYLSKGSFPCFTGGSVTSSLFPTPGGGGGTSR